MLIQVIRFYARKLPALIGLALISLLIIDLGYLVYEHRYKEYVVPALGQKFAAVSTFGSATKCEADSWWFQPQGAQPWQRVRKEELDYPIAFSILAFERPDQVS